MSLAGLAGIAATAPLCPLIDRITTKRAAVVLAVFCIAAGGRLVVASKQLWIVAAGQVLIGMWRRFWAISSGSATSLERSASWRWRPAPSCLLSTRSALTMRQPVAVSSDDSSAWWYSRPILLLAGTVFAFQTANGAMLPFIAQALIAQGDDPSLTTGAMTVTAQGSMIGAALLVPRLSRRAAFLALGAVAAIGLQIWIIGLRTQAGGLHEKPQAASADKRGLA